MASTPSRLDNVINLAKSLTIFKTEVANTLIDGLTSYLEGNGYPVRSIENLLVVGGGAIPTPPIGGGAIPTPFIGGGVLPGNPIGGGVIPTLAGGGVMPTPLGGGTVPTVLV